MRAVAVIPDNASLVPCLRDTSYPHVLASFMFRTARRFMQEPADYCPTVLLDSGAFTVWTRGESVDLDAYIAWAQSVRASWQADVRITNLDVIPGDSKSATPPTSDERLDAARRGMENADRIRAAGLPVIEVFHRFEPLAVLDELCDRMRPGDMIGVGGLVGRGSAESKMPFCDSVFAYLRDRYTWGALPSVHGYGVSVTSKLATRYPWFSTDSIGWVAPTLYGQRMGRAGRSTGRVGAPVRGLTDVDMMRALRGWDRVAESLTRLWHDRGVRFTEDMQVAA